VDHAGLQTKSGPATVTGEDEPAADEIVYAFRLTLLGAPQRFALTPEGIRWSAGRGSGLVPYKAVRSVRLSYKPANMQSHRFMTEIRAEGAPRLRIVSTSLKNMFEQERQDKAYVAFVTALHRKLEEAGAQVQYEQGTHPLIYWTGATVFVLICLGIAALAVRGLQQDSVAGAAFIAAFLLLFLWQGRNFFRRNRPGHYGPGALPEQVLPKA
jgi:hypothetical protein